MGIICLNIFTFFLKCQVNKYSFYVRDGVYFYPQMSTFWKMQRCRQYTWNIFLNCHKYTNIFVGSFVVCTSALENFSNFDMTHTMKMHKKWSPFPIDYFTDIFINNQHCMALINVPNIKRNSRRLKWGIVDFSVIV